MIPERIIFVSRGITVHSPHRLLGRYARYSSEFSHVIFPPSVVHFTVHKQDKGKAYVVSLLLCLGLAPIALCLLCLPYQRHQVLTITTYKFLVCALLAKQELLLHASELTLQFRKHYVGLPLRDASTRLAGYIIS